MALSLRLSSVSLCVAGFDVARTGVASVGFIGFPSVGKSTLMSKLTGQHSEGMCRKSRCLLAHAN